MYGVANLPMALSFRQPRPAGELRLQEPENKSHKLQ